MRRLEALIINIQHLRIGNIETFSNVISLVELIGLLTQELPKVNKTVY